MKDKVKSLMDDCTMDNSSSARTFVRESYDYRSMWSDN